MTEPTHTQEICHYTLHTNGIHEFRLITPNRAAWDAYVQALNDLMAASLDQPNLRVILDLTAGTIPLAHAAKTYYAFIKRFPNRPPIRYAVLHGDNFLMSLADSLARSVKAKNDEIHLFHSNNYDAAVTWLLDD